MESQKEIQRNQNIPVTDSFNIAADINIRDEKLAATLQKSAMGGASTQEKTEMIQALIGRDVSVAFTQERGGSYYYETDHIDLGKTPLHWTLGVAEDNLPPNVPKSFTPELASHLKALHESEHATQNVVQRDPITGHVTGYVESFTVSNRSTSEYGLAEKVIKEADADNVVLQHLDDLDLPEVKDFWLDARMNRSFVEQFLSSRDEAIEHDTASVLRHFEQTGDVIDVDQFIEEKQSLMGKLNEEFDFGMEKYYSVIMEYEIDPQKLAAEQGKYQQDLAVKPQQLMHAVQSLLDKGDLDGLQKWEAENYMGSMRRLGYVPDGNYTIEAQIRDVLHNKMGFALKEQQAEKTMADIDVQINTPAP